MPLLRTEWSLLLHALIDDGISLAAYATAETHGTVLERRSLAGKLSLSCAQSVADG